MNAESIRALLRHHYLAGTIPVEDCRSKTVYEFLSVVVPAADLLGTVLEPVMNF